MVDAEIAQADFTGALYDHYTRFSADFSPEEHGLVWEDEAGDLEN